MFSTLSIITRTHGQRGRYLKLAAESVFSQAYRPIEWVVIEDGPSEAANVLSSLPMLENTTVKRVANPKLGRSHAANRALDEMSGDYFCFLDDDDQLFPDHGQKLVSLLKSQSDAAGAYAASYMTRRDSDGKVVGDDQVYFVPSAGSELFLRTNVFPIQAVVVRRSTLFHQRFDTSLDALEDWLFWTELFLEKKLIWTPDITSRFFVPSCDYESSLRLGEHTAAEEHFKIQVEALLKERGLADANRVLEAHDQRLQFLWSHIVRGDSECAI